MKVAPETKKAAAWDRGLKNIDHLGGLICTQDSPSSPLLQAARRLQRRFGLSESSAMVTAIHAGLASCEVR